MANLVKMTPEAERIAEAGQVLKMYGDEAPAFIATRIGAFALDGDDAGFQRWTEIAERVAMLMGLRGLH